MMKQMRIAACGVLLAGTLAAGAQIVVRIGPPPPRPVEVIPVAPGPDYAWHPGYHRWDGHAYVWTPGRYEHPPYAHAHWVEGNWGQGHGGYQWHEGHWAR
jgi:hypothetical protein